MSVISQMVSSFIARIWIICAKHSPRSLWFWEHFKKYLSQAAQLPNLPKDPRSYWGPLSQVPFLTQGHTDNPGTLAVEIDPKFQLIFYKNQ